MRRRDLIFCGAAVLAAGSAAALRPHKRLNLLGERKMADVVPPEFGVWKSQSADGLVQPEAEGKLASLLYSELVSRVYVNEVSGDEIMMLIAYGDTQSDLLQLHRPESCYPAVGFRLVLSEPVKIPISPGAVLPCRKVRAERSDRDESILYWTRLGEYFPVSAGDQRKVRLQTAMNGFIPDGALFRLSTVKPGASAFDLLGGFVTDLLSAVAPAQRKALVGTNLSAKLANV